MKTATTPPPATPDPLATLAEAEQDVRASREQLRDARSSAARAIEESAALAPNTAPPAPNQKFLAVLPEDHARPADAFADPTPAATPQAAARPKRPTNTVQAEQPDPARATSAPGAPGRPRASPPPTPPPVKPPPVPPTPRDAGLADKGTGTGARTRPPPPPASSPAATSTPLPSPPADATAGAPVPAPEPVTTDSAGTGTVEHDAQKSDASAAADAGGGEGEDGQVLGLQWLRFVRSDGVASADGPEDPDARYISDRAVSSPELRRTLADTRRSNGEGDGDAPVASKPGNPARSPTPSPAVPTPSDSRSDPPADAPPMPSAPPPPPASPRDPVTVELPEVADGVGPAPDPPEGGLRLTVGPITTSKTPGTARSNEKPSRTSRQVKSAEAARKPPVEAAPPPPTPALVFTDEFWDSPIQPGEPSPSNPDVPVTGATWDPTHLGTDDSLVAEKAHGWSAIAILDEQAPLGSDTRFTASRRAEGEWMPGVEGPIRNAWVYPANLRALGVSGTVVVRFRVRRDGTVEDKVVWASSNVPELDLAALAAIPPRVAPMPREVSGTSRYISYTFRYGEPSRER